MTMRLLLTNDDGIHSPGLAALWRRLGALGEITVVAPTREQSGVGHGISIKQSLHVFPWPLDGIRAYAVHGTPSDCVKIALYDLLDEPPDAVISGINLGLNVGINALYSGTVAAAMEGAINGIPGLALSTDGADFDGIADLSVRFVRLIEKGGVSPHTILNVNVPQDSSGGIEITRQSPGGIREEYHKEDESHGHATFKVRGVLDPSSREIEYDDAAVQGGYISVTPMTFDLTHHPSLDSLREVIKNGGIPGTSA